MAKKPEAPKEDENAEKAPAAEGETVEGAEGEGGGKKSGLKKIILFVVVPLFLLAGIGAGLYFSGMLDKFLKKDQHVEGDAAAGEAGEKVAEGEKKKEKCKDAGKKAEGGKKEGGHGEKKAEKHSDDGCDTGEAVFLEIPNMLVNLSGPDEQPRYLRLKVQLELANDSDMEAVKNVMPRVVDQFQTYLRELRIKDLRGSAGIYRLQMELLSRVNAAAYPTEVKDVLFQEILIQ